MSKSWSQPAENGDEFIAVLNLVADAIRDEDAAAFVTAGRITSWLARHDGLAKKCLPNPLDRNRDPSTAFQKELDAWREDEDFAALAKALFGVDPKVETWNDGLYIRLLNLASDAKSDHLEVSRGDVLDLEQAFGSNPASRLYHEVNAHDLTKPYTAVSTSRPSF